MYNDMGDLDTSYLNKSINSINKTSTSATSGSVNTSSSKAVLAALRALQDKIRRLESERSQALDESADLRQKIKTLEVESTHVKDRQNLAAQKTLNEARHANDVIQTEKSEIEFRMRKYEERYKQEHRGFEDLQEKYKLIEQEHQSMLYQLKDITYQKDQLEVIFDNAQRREKDLAHTMVSEKKRHENEVVDLHNKISMLKIELEEVGKGKVHSESKINELDHFVSQLLDINSTLVSKLSGSPRKKALKKPTKMKGYDAANKSTVCSDGHKVTKYEARKHSQLVPVSSEDLAQLKAMHRMYTNIAKNIIHNKEGGSKSGKIKAGGSSMKLGRSFSSTSSRSKGGSPHHSSSSMEHKSERKVTRLSAKKERKAAASSSSSSSVDGTTTHSAGYLGRGRQQQVQTVPKSYSNSSSPSPSPPRRDREDIRIPRPSSTHAMDTTDRMTNSSIDYEQYLNSKHFFNRPSPSSSSPHSHSRSLHNHQSPTSFNVSALEEAVRSVESDVGMRKSNNGSGSSSTGGAIFTSAFGHLHQSNSSSSSGSNGHYGSSKSNEDLNAVITSLENEFDSLNLQYRQLLSTVQSDSPSEAVQTQAEQIVEVIQKLHKKGEQLRALKSPAK